MTAEETLNLVAKQWCTLEGIMKLGHLGPALFRGQKYIAHKINHY